MNNMDNLKRLAGIKEAVSEVLELHVYMTGNSRPFISEGSSAEITDEVNEILNKDGWTKLEIIPKK